MHSFFAPAAGNHHFPAYSQLLWFRSFPDSKSSRIWDTPTESLFATGEIPAFKLYESDKVLAFLDIQPLSSGHAVSCFHVFIVPRITTHP